MHHSPRNPGILRASGAGLLAGLLLVAATRPEGTGPLAFLALTPLLAVAVARAPLPRVFLAGWLAGLCFFGVGFGWVLTVRGAIGVPLPVYVSGVALLALGLGAIAALLQALRRGFGAGVALAAAPGLWVAYEWLRSCGPLGMPWLQLGTSLADWPALIQPAALGGGALLSAWVVAGNAALVAALRRPGRTALVRVVALGAVPVLYGVLDPDPGPAEPGLRVAVVQPDVPEEERHHPPRFDAHLRTLLALSDQATAPGADLLVWPETAYERPIDGRGDPFLGSIASGLGVPLLTGVREFATPAGSTLRNAVALAEPGALARTVAGKVHPVPVYESAPHAPWAQFLADLGAWPGRVVPVERAGLVHARRLGADPLPVGLLICFDASDDDVARDLRRRGARLLVGLYNEAQAGRWVAHQHELLARLRAVENRVPMVRVANTGRSVWIDARGRVTDALPADRAASGVAAITPAGAAPLYTRIGDVPVLVLGMMIPSTFAVARSGRVRGRNAIPSQTRRKPIHV